MAMPDSTGRMHHSASRAKLHDEMNEKPAAPATKPAMDGGASKDVSHMDIGEVVSKHGPASKVEVMHDHEAGAHHVTSHHKGAHHKSTHGSAKEAHQHGAMAAGDQDEEKNEALDGEESPDNEMQEHEGNIPGLA